MLSVNGVTLRLVDRSLLLDLYAAFFKSARIVDRAVEGVDIAPEDYAFLSMIGDRDATPTQLAREFGHSLSTVLFRANRTVELGYVQRVENPRDGRSFHLRLTAKGRRAWEQASLNLWQMVKRIETHLDRPAAELQAALRDLESAFDIELSDEPPRRR